MAEHATSGTSPEATFWATAAHRLQPGAWVRRVNWWLVLVGLAIVFGLLVAAPYTAAAPYVHKKVLERVALPLAAFTWLVSLARLGFSRQRYDSLLAIACTALFMREIHFKGSDELLAALALTVLVLAWRWWDQILPSLNDKRTFTWVAFALVAFVFSQFIAKRGFKLLPNERFFHESAEEGMENFAHLMMLVAVWVGPWRARSGNPAG